MPVFPFPIRELATMRVQTEADNRSEEYDPDDDCFAGWEFRNWCSRCGSYIEDGHELREVDAGTPGTCSLCDRCVADLEDSGVLTRCEACEELFTSSRLKINPENGLREICPLCGEVWCA